MKLMKITCMALAALMTVSPAFAADQDVPSPRPFASITSSQGELFQSRIGLQHGSETEAPRHLYPTMRAFFDDVQKKPRYRMYLSRINKSNKEEVLHEMKEDLYTFFMKSLENKQSQSMAFGSGSTQFNIDPKKLNAKALEATTQLMELIRADVEKKLQKSE